MSTTVELPETIVASARELAAKHGLTVEDFVSLAIADRAGADEVAERFFKERERRVLPSARQAALPAIPNYPADPHDAKERHLVDADKTAELDFSYARDELRTRAEWNKKLQQVQYTIIGALLASSKLLPDHLGLVSVGGLLLNYIFLHETVKNLTYIRLAALYIVKIVNKRYREPVCEWECYINVMRKRPKSFFDKYLHAVESSVLLPGSVILICSVLFTYSSTKQPWDQTLMIKSSVFASLLALNLLDMFLHVRNRSRLRSFYSPQELDEFCLRYNLTNGL